MEWLQKKEMKTFIHSTKIVLYNVHRVRDNMYWMQAVLLCRASKKGEADRIRNLQNMYDGEIRELWDTDLDFIVLEHVDVSHESV